MNDDRVIRPVAWQASNGEIEWSRGDEVMSEIDLEMVEEPESWPITFGLWTFVVAFLVFLTVMIALD